MEIKKIEKQIGVGCADIEEKDKRYVLDVLNTGRLSYGPYSTRLEKQFAALHEVNYAQLVNSGTSALRLAVHCLRDAHNWQAGDEIICPAVTFVASANVIVMNGLKPVFVDVCPHTYNIDPEKIEAKITEKTRAIMVVNLFGQIAEMDPILRLARRYNLKIIEDSCETMFVTYKGKPAGSFGDISCFSTYMAHLITTGVGGLVCTNNKDYAVKLKSLANHGRDGIYLNIDSDQNLSGLELSEVVSRRFRFTSLGYSFRLTEMEAALGLGQIERKDSILLKRKQHAHYLREGLKPLVNYLQLPWWPFYKEHAFMMFPLVIKPGAGINKKELVMHLEKYNIETRDMLPLINQPVYKEMFVIEEADYPIANWINNNGFYIGCHQKLTKEELDYIVKVFFDFFKTK